MDIQAAAHKAEVAVQAAPEASFDADRSADLAGRWSSIQWPIRKSWILKNVNINNQETHVTMMPPDSHQAQKVAMLISTCSSVHKQKNFATLLAKHDEQFNMHLLKLWD